MILVVYIVLLPGCSFARAYSASSSEAVRVGYPSLTIICPTSCIGDRYLPRAVGRQGEDSPDGSRVAYVDPVKGKGRPANCSGTGTLARYKDGLRLTQSADPCNASRSAAYRRAAALKPIQVKSAHPCVGDEHAPRPTGILHERTVGVLGVTYNDLSVCGSQLDASAIICAASRLPPLKIGDLQATQRHRIPPVLIDCHDGDIL